MPNTRFSAVNGILGKRLNTDSKGVILQLFGSKCMPVYFHTDLRSPDYTVNRVLMKIFKTGNVQIVQECRVFLVFNCQVFCWLDERIILLKIRVICKHCVQFFCVPLIPYAN